MQQVKDYINDNALMKCGLDLRIEIFKSFNSLNDIKVKDEFY